MQQEGKLRYTLILGICMIASLALIGKMLLGGQNTALPIELTEQQEGAPMEFVITDEMLRDAILQALPQKPKKLDATIAPQGTVSVSALLSRKALSQLELADSVKMLVQLLPELCEVRATWQVSLQEGTVRLTANEVSIAGVSLPQQIVQPFSEAIAVQIGSLLEQSDVTPNGLRFTQGSMILTA